MKLQHKVGQIRNLFRKLPEKDRELNWVFIYGLPRAGTSYVLNQFLKVARCGIGDWELKEFFRFIRNTRDRDYVTLDTERAMAEMRDNILDNAHVGGGTQLDIAVKQIDCTKEELLYLQELFGGPPQEKLFLFREPSGWLSSAKDKFDLDDEAAVELYERSIASYELIGGQKLEYREGMEKDLQRSTFLKNTAPDPFEASQKREEKVPERLRAAYDAIRAVE
ncbi:MAG: hypothetical protein ABEH38_05965 [Flavobacteriales bacterium]